MLANSGLNGPPCGVPSSRRTQTRLHHPGSEEPSDERQHPFVFDSPGYSRHQDVVLNPVEEFLQIQVHHDAPSLGYILTGLP